MPLRMEQSCHITNSGNEYHGYEWQKNEGCTPWHKTGTSLKAYSSEIDDVTIDFDLIYPVYFDVEGSVEFKYRKDSLGIKTSEYPFGVFKFYIDDIIQIKDDKPERDDWNVEQIDYIPPGFHTFKWTYSKYNWLPYTEFLEAEIEYIVIRGRHSTELTTCYPCRFGHSFEGSGYCEMCPENTFFYQNPEDYSQAYCAECPTGTFSHEGSIGEKMCQPKRPCDRGDIDKEYSQCINGFRTVSYYWEDADNDKELDCDIDNEKSTVKKLPPDE